MGSQEFIGLGWGKRLGALALSSVLLFGACSSDDPEPDSAKAETKTATIEISTFVFNPKTLTVPVGTTVEWINNDGILHTATSGKQVRQGVPGVGEDEAARPDGTFDLQLDGKGSSATFTFDEPGTYAYFCDVHAAMTGRIVVR